MNRRLWLPLAAVLAMWYAPASAAVLDARAIQSETLANGLRLIVAPEPEAKVVSVQVIVKVGSADDPPGATGMTHLLEHLLWVGEGSEDSEPRASVERVGGVTDAGTLRDYTRFCATVPSGYAELAMGSLARIVLRRSPGGAALERERRVIRDEGEGRSENPLARLYDAAFAEVYGAHPYANTIDGRPEDLGAITSPQLVRFQETWYVPNNMAVVVAGGVEFEQARATVTRYFGGLSPAPVPFRSRPAPPRPAMGRERIVPTASAKAYVMAAFVGPEVGEHYQVCASDLLATLLVEGPVSRLVGELKEKRGAASEVGVEFLTQRERALFGVWAACEPERVEEVKAGIRAEMHRLAAAPIPPGELARARRLLAAGYIFANETPADRATTLGFYEAIDTYRTASSYLSWVTHTTPEALAEVAHWYSGEPVWVILRPEHGR